MTIYRFPDAPKDFTDAEKKAWNDLTRVLNLQQQDAHFGNPQTVSTQQLKNGVVAQGFTKVSALSYHMKQTDGTILCSAAAGTMTIYLTSAVVSNLAVKRVKKIDSSTNKVLITPIGSDKIDGTLTVLSVKAQNNCYELACDGKKWWIVGKV